MAGSGSSSDSGPESLTMAQRFGLFNKMLVFIMVYVSIFSIRTRIKR